MPITITAGSTAHRASLVMTWGALAVVALALPFSFGPYRVFQFTMVLVWAVAVLGLNLLIGYNGQISIGHNAFFAIGAFTAAILIDRYSAPLLLCFLAAAVVTFLLGLGVGVPALRLSGLHLAIVTLALAMVVGALLKRFDSLTGGSQGLSVPSTKAPAWTGLANDQWLYFIALATAVVMFVLGRNLVNSRFGRAIVAIRDNPLAAEANGIRSSFYKTVTFAISGMYAGVAGVLYVLVVSFASPEAFPLLLSVTLLAAVAVGGLATISGAVLGALFIQFVPVYASEVNASLASIIYGGILILMMFLMPSGAVGLLRLIARRVVRIEDSEVAEQPSAADRPAVPPQSVLDREAPVVTDAR